MQKPELNVGLLDLVLKTIEADPAHWNQSTWRTISAGDRSTLDFETCHTVYGVTCDTAFCFAGWAVQLGSVEAPKWVSREWLLPTAEERQQGNHYCISASERAIALLGLTRYEASELFYGHNDLDDIKHEVAQIKERRS